MNINLSKNKEYFSAIHNFKYNLKTFIHIKTINFAESIIKYSLKYYYSIVFTKLLRKRSS